VLQAQFAGIYKAGFTILFALYQEETAEPPLVEEAAFQGRVRKEPTNFSLVPTGWSRACPEGLQRMSRTGICAYIDEEKSDD
jgi:hypothetical protein